MKKGGKVKGPAPARTIRAFAKADGNESRHLGSS